MGERTEGRGLDLEPIRESPAKSPSGGTARMGADFVALIRRITAGAEYGVNTRSRGEDGGCGPEH